MDPISLVQIQILEDAVVQCTKPLFVVLEFWSANSSPGYPASNPAPVHEFGKAPDDGPSTWVSATRV